MRDFAFSTAVILLICASAIPVFGNRGVGSIELSANPSAVSADGKSSVTVTARVRDRESQFVPDGTEIRFSASMGVIEESALTSSGAARVKLVSSELPGTSVITAIWVEGQAAATVTVEFGEETVAPGGPHYIDVAAEKYLAYSSDYEIIEALGNVRIRYRGLELSAHEAQVDITSNRVVARGEGRDNPLSLNTADGPVTADFFACELWGTDGVLLSAAQGTLQRVDMSKGLPVISEGPPAYMPESFDFVDLSDSGVVIRASEVTVFLGEKMHFRDMRLYIDGKKTLALPYYLVSLSGVDVESGQYLGYGTGGFTLNLPVYYSLTPSSSGAVLFRHGDRTGWGEYGLKPGWFVDVRQKYATSREQGAIVFSQVTGDNWGAHFYHHQDLGRDSRGYVYVDYPAHRDLFASMNLSRSFGSYDVGLTLDMQDFDVGDDSVRGDLYLNTRARPVGNSRLRYSVSARTSYASDWKPGHEVRTNLYSSPVKLGDNVSFRSSLGAGYVWGGRLSGLSTLATSVLEWRMSPYSSLSLTYRYVDRTSIYSTSTAGRQALSAVCRISDGKRWRMSLYGIKGLDHETTNVFGDISYRLDPKWRLGVASTYNEYRDVAYRDLEISVGRMIGDRELLAVWSESRKKVMFEIGLGGF